MSASGSTLTHAAAPRLQAARATDAAPIRPRRAQPRARLFGKRTALVGCGVVAVWFCIVERRAAHRGGLRSGGGPHRRPPACVVVLARVALRRGAPGGAGALPLPPGAQGAAPAVQGGTLTPTPSGRAPRAPRGSTRWPPTAASNWPKRSSARAIPSRLRRWPSCGASYPPISPRRCAKKHSDRPGTAGVRASTR